MLEHFHFLRPEWGLLIVPPLAALIIQWRRERSDQAWDNIIAPHLLKALRLRQFRHKLFGPVTAASLLMVLMALIAMGPSWRQQSSPLARDEAALVILLDASRSMESEDIQPSRLIRARQKISDLLAFRRGAQTALVVYAGSAHTVLNLTDDAEILRQYLSALEPAVMPRQGKFPEYALPLVEQIVSDSTAPTTVLLLSDGITPAGTAAFRQWFDVYPHQLIVLGVGTETPADGMAPLESVALRDLARSVGGRYLDLTTDDADVRAIDRAVDAHYVVTEDSAVPWQDGGYWLVFPCLALFMLWFRRGWTLQWGLVAVLLAGSLQTGDARAEGFLDLWLTPDQQGRLLLERGEYGAAAERFADPSWKAFAYYYDEQFELAAEYYSRIDSPIARFNQANALAHGQHYLRALALYEELLRDDPQNASAEQNRQIVQDLVDAINAMSEAQAEEGLGSRELGDDEPRRADGAERTMAAEQVLEQFSAEQILQDEKISEMWLRSVQRNPSHFLSVKFSMQLEQRREER